jgi:hypothetical protein
LNPRILLLPTAAAALLVAACGGSSASTNSPAASAAGGSIVSKAEFIKQADAICAAGTLANKALTVPGDPATATAADLPAWSTYLDQVGAAINVSAKQLAALPAPDADIATATTWLTQSAAIFTDLGTTNAAAKQGDLAAFQAAWTKTAADTATANQTATTFGLVDCAK